MDIQPAGKDSGTEFDVPLDIIVFALDVNGEKTESLVGDSGNVGVTGDGTLESVLLLDLVDLKLESDDLFDKTDFFDDTDLRDLRRLKVPCAAVSSSFTSGFCNM